MLSEKIRELRGALSQSELASQIGIAQSSLGNYERGDRVPDANVIIKLAKHFNVSVDYLLEVSPYRNYEEESAEREVEKLSTLPLPSDALRKRLGSAIHTIVQNRSNISEDKFLECAVLLCELTAEMASDFSDGSEMLMDCPNFTGMNHKSTRHGVLNTCFNYINRMNNAYPKCNEIIKNTIEPLQQQAREVTTEYIDADYFKEIEQPQSRPLVDRK